MNIRDTRKEYGLTQEQLARELGVTLITVNRWERGITKPSPLALKVLELWLKDKKSR